MEVKPMTSDNLTRETLDELEQYVKRQLSGRVFDFRLDVNPMGLVLTGKTNTYYAKQMAQHVIMESVDFPISSNAIEVN